MTNMQNPKGEITYNEVAQYECGQEDGHTQLICSSHTVPQRLNPLATQHTEYHHECMENVLEMPPVKGI